MAFTSKILQLLVKENIIDSHKGPTGGFHMTSERIDRTTLQSLVEAIDGDSIYNGCGLGMKQCDARRPCPVHDKFSIIRAELKKMLSTTTVYELSKGLEVGLTLLKR